MRALYDRDLHTEVVLESESAKMLNIYQAKAPDSSIYFSLIYITVYTYNILCKYIFGLMEGQKKKIISRQNFRLWKIQIFSLISDI